MPHNGVGTGVDDPVTTVGLDADGRLEEPVHRLRPGHARQSCDQQDISQHADPPGYVGPVKTTVVQGCHRDSHDHHRDEYPRYYPVPTLRPPVAVDTSGDDIGIDPPQVQGDQDRSPHDHDEEQPAPCPCPVSSRKEQAQEEDEQRPPDAEDQTATVGRFRLPYLIAVGRHVFYLLSKIGTANRAFCGRFGRSSPQILEAQLLTSDLTLTGHRDQLHPCGDSPPDRVEVFQMKHVGPGAFHSNLSTALIAACPGAFHEVRETGYTGMTPS